MSLSNYHIFDKKFNIIDNNILSKVISSHRILICFVSQTLFLPCCFHTQETNNLSVWAGGRENRIQLDSNSPKIEYTNSYKTRSTSRQDLHIDFAELGRRRCFENFVIFLFFPFLSLMVTSLNSISDSILDSGASHINRRYCLGSRQRSLEDEKYYLSIAMAGLSD